MDEATFLKEFAHVVHASPIDLDDITHRLVMMDVLTPEGLTPNEHSLYREAVHGIMSPAVRVGVVAVLKIDRGVNDIVTTDEMIDKLVAWLETGFR